MTEEPTHAEAALEPVAEAAAPPSYSHDQLLLAVAEGKIAVLKSVAAAVNGVLDKANINSIDHGNVKMAFQQAAAMAEADGKAAIERMKPQDEAAEEAELDAAAAEVEPAPAGA